MSHGLAEDSARPGAPIFPEPATGVTRHAGAPVDLETEIPLLLHNAAGLARQHGCRLEFAVQPHLSVAVQHWIFRAAMREFLRQAIARAHSCVLVGAQRHAGRVKITVSDDGSGVAGALHEIYAAIQPLATQGATTQVESRPGRGTTLVLTLPDGSAVAASEPAAGYRT